MQEPGNETTPDKRYLLRLPWERWWRLRALAARLRRDKIAVLLNEWIEEKLREHGA